MNNIYAFVLMSAMYITTGWTWLFSQTTELVIQSGHTSNITCLEFSKDGRWLVTGGQDGRLIVWDARSSLQYRMFPDSSSEMKAVSFDCSGKYVLGATRNRAIIYQIDNGAIVFQHEQVGGECNGTLHPNKFVLALSNSSKIEIIDLATNSKIQTFYRPIPGVTFMKYSPDGLWLALGGGCGSFALMDAENGYKKVFEKARDNVCHDVISVDFTPDSKTLTYLIESNFDQGTIVFFNVKSKKEYARVQTPCNRPKQVSISKDGKTLAVVGTTLCILDMKKGNLIQETGSGGGAGTAWSTDGKFLAVAWERKALLNSRGKLFAFDMHEAGNLNNIMYSLESYAMPFSAYDVNPAEDMIAFGFVEGVVHTLNLKTGYHKGRYLEPINRFPSVSFSPNGAMLGCGNGNARIIETSSLKDLKIFERTGASHMFIINRILFSSDNQYVFGCGTSISQYSFLRKWNARDFSLIISRDSVSDKWNEYMVLSPDNQTLVSINQDGQMCLYDANNGKWTRSTEKGSSDVFKHWQRGISFTPDGKKIVAATSDEYVYFYDAATLEREQDSLKVGHAAIIKFNPAGNFMAVSGFDSIGSINIYDAQHSYKLLKTIKGPYTIAWSRDGKFIISASRDGTIKFWNTETGEMVASYIGTGDNDFVLVTPDNYYMASKSGGKGIGFRINDKILPFDQFDMKFNRPDIVLGRLGYASFEMIAALKRAWEKRLAGLNFRSEPLSGDFHLPEIAITSKNIPSSTMNNILQFEIKATDSKYKLNRIVVYDNDVAVFGKMGIDIQTKNTNEITLPVTLPLQNGKNKITISAFNEQGSESIREILFIYNMAEKKPSDLYLVAIGVSDYAVDDYDLKYAAKDAGDLANLIESGKGLHRTVKVLRIFDKDATRENILKSKDFLMQSTVDDDVMVFFAGHGLLDDQLDYYLATHDIDFNEPAGKGLAYRDFENLLDGIPARHKLMLMDACHSGEVDKEENVLITAKQENQGAVKSRAFRIKAVAKKSLGLQNSFELMQQLFADLNKGTGAMVISSAGGAEYAYESETWNNGVFTFCILEGLKTRMADADHDGQIRVSELRDYVIDKVQILTQGKQRPTSRKENSEFDFRVW